MMYNKKILASFVIFMIGSIYAQDNIINEIAKGGKFIVRDVEQNEAMVIEEGNVGFSGTLKLGVLPEGNISNSIVVWDPEDKLLKLQDQSLSTGLTNKFKEEGWHTLGYDGLADDNATEISASVQGTASVKWNKFSTNYGYIRLGPAHKWTAHIYTDRPKFLFNKPIFSYDGSFSAFTTSNLELETHGTPRLTILASNGNVGIGTTNPNAKLDVAGQIKIAGGYPGYGKVLTSDATGLATWQTPAAGSGGTVSSTLWTESGSNVYRTSGNIGIGTTNPEHNLEVNGADSRVIVHYAGQSRGGIQALGSQNRGIALMTTSTNDNLLFGYSDASPTSADFVTRMVIINGNGRVGIGTTNPSAKLDVAGQVKITGGTPGLGKVLTSDATGLATWQTPAAGGGSTLWTELGSDLYRTSGNIGIGTANPRKLLHIESSIVNESQLILESTGNPGKYGGLEFKAEHQPKAAIYFERGSNTGVGQDGYYSTGKLHFVTDSAHDNNPVTISDSKMVIDHDGKVGIGTTNPSAKLDVAGQVKITGGTPGLGKVLTSDATGLATWQTPAVGGGSTLWTESGSNIYRTGGNVGIGTTNPSAKLDVNGSAIIGDNTSSSYLHVGNAYCSSAANSLNPGVYVYKSGLNSYGLKLQYTGSEYGTMMFGPNSTNRFLSFGKVGSALEDDDMIEYMRIDLDDGNVGIGTANPSAKLDVNGTASAKRYVVNGIYDITNGVWDLSRGNLAQVTYNSSITPITINSDGSAGSYVLVVNKNNSCTDCNIIFSGATVKYPGGVNPTLSSGSNTTDIFSFIAVGNNTFYCFYAKNLK